MNRLEEGKVENDVQVSNFLSRNSETSRWRLPKRYVVSLLIGMALFVANWMNVNFGVAIVHILTTHHYSREFYPKEYTWSTEDLGLMDSSFFWGYAAGQIPGALLVLSFPAHSMLFVSLLLTSMLHPMMPLTLNYHPGFTITLNLLQGLSQGIIFPATIGMFIEWAPPAESTRLVTIAFSGYYLGSMLGYPISLYIAEHLGEEIPFFASAIAGLLWCLLWTCHTYDTPTKDPAITQKELSYLEETITPDIKAPISLKKIPLKSMLSSLPLWANCIASFCFYGSLLVSTMMSMILVSMSDLAFATIPIPLPNTILSLILPLSGFFIDFLINKKYLSTGAARKLFCGGAFALFCSLNIAIVACEDDYTNIVLHHVAFGCLGFAISGFEVNNLDICRRYAALATGISTFFGTLAGIIFTLVLRNLSFTPDFDNRNKLSYPIIVLSAVAACVYGYCASGETQEWAKLEQDRVEEQQSTYRSGAEYYPNEENEDKELVDDHTRL